MIVSSEYIGKTDHILIVDDFLAGGNASSALVKIVESAGASVAGISVAIEKGFQGGGDKLRSRGYRIESLAIIDSLGSDGIRFRN